jgi:hypothetical protein
MIGCGNRYRRETMTVYSPKTLAERWGVSRTHIYNMMRQYEKWILDGRSGAQQGLAYFRLGGMYRIRGDEVDRIEKCDLENTEESFASISDKENENLYVPPTLR